MIVFVCFLGTDTDRTSTVDLTPTMVDIQSVLISGMKVCRVGPSSSPGAKNPAGPTETGQALALHRHLIETESPGTETRFGLICLGASSSLS